jgi:hypothetical protein
MAEPRSAPATIRRVDFPDKQLVGFLVQAWHDGHRIRRFFSDRRYGGKQRALQVARGFAAQLGRGDEFAALLRRLKPRKNSRFGEPGVARYERETSQSPFWVAYWDEDGRKLQKKFAVSLYGEARARELAHKVRQKAVKAYVKRLTELRRQDARLLRSIERQGFTKVPRAPAWP